MRQCPKLAGRTRHSCVTFGAGMLWRGIVRRAERLRTGFLVRQHEWCGVETVERNRPHNEAGGGAVDR